MLPRIKRVLADWLASGARGIGQIEIQAQGSGFNLCHVDDAARDQLKVYRSPEDAIELAKFDDAGSYRPLKTAPNLQHGWRLELGDLAHLERALDFFYPGRLAALAAWESNRLTTTSLRETLNRQSGMYRAASKISDHSMDQLVGSFCRSRDGQPGCLRTILWARDPSGARPSLRLPLDKFIAPLDQTGRGEKIIPLLCQEACNLLVAAAREEVKSGSPIESEE
jgi:sirohydrochlorin cobaltochelatase